jgi:hypothetical protein
MKIEDFVHRKGELSHMSRCTSDVAVYKPTLKIFLHRRSLGCSIVRCVGGSTAMEFRYVLLRVRIRSRDRIRRIVDRIRKVADRSRRLADRSRKMADVSGGLLTVASGLPTVYGSWRIFIRKLSDEFRNSRNP